MGAGQVPRRLRTRRDLLTLLAGAAELAVCPGCPDRNTWTDLAGDADALYAPDGATIVARVETNRSVEGCEQGSDALSVRSDRSDNLYFRTVSAVIRVVLALPPVQW